VERVLSQVAAIDLRCAVQQAFAGKTCTACTAWKGAASATGAGTMVVVFDTFAVWADVVGLSDRAWAVALALLAHTAMTGVVAAVGPEPGLGMLEQSRETEPSVLEPVAETAAAACST
jgi:hypothetical protein